jgi:hypothetical protein
MQRWIRQSSGFFRQLTAFGLNNFKFMLKDFRVFSWQVLLGLMLKFDCKFLDGAVAVWY